MIRYQGKNWLRLILTIRGSVLPRIAGRIVIVASVAAFAAYLQIERGISLSIPGIVHTMVGVALGLLLVFRTNASYDRYWEGRKILGGLVSNCRDLARQSCAYLADANSRIRAGGYAIALFSTMRRALRNETDYSELKGVLSDDEFSRLCTANAPPLQVSVWFSDMLAKEVTAGRLSEERLFLMDRNLSELIDLLGGAQRIVNTPVPFAYAHHIKAFLTLFCLSAPLALLDPMGWYTPLASAVVAYGLFGIDEIGVEIEDPFGYDANDLPLDEIGAALNADIAALLLLAGTAEDS